MKEREMFGSSVSSNGRKWYTVPLSIAVHTALIAAVVIIPLMANGELPVPPSILKFVRVDIQLPSPPVVRRGPDRPKIGPTDTADPKLAPVVPPPDLGPEKDPPTGDPKGDPKGEDFGVPPGILPTGPAVPPLPPAPPPLVPIRVGGKIKPPQKILHVPPVYPLIAQQARVSGMVIIEATIGTDGRVKDARILRSIPLLDQAAIEAVKHWQFTPTLLNGVPVPVIMTVTVNFTLQP